MEVEAQETRTNQATFRKRLNELTSASRILPDETLVEIFSYVCADRLSFQNIRNSQTRACMITYPIVQIISNVCSSWREIARAAPSLWSQVCIELPHDEWASFGSFIILKLHFANAKSLPLSIEFRLNSLLKPARYFRTNESYVPCSQLVDFLFFQNPDRLGSVTIRTFTESGWWLRGFACPPTSSPMSNGGNRVVYPNLISLILTDDTRCLEDDTPVHPLFEGAVLPRLQYLSLCHSLMNPHIPLDNLTALHLSDIMAKEAIDILIRYPRLIEFHVKYWSVGVFVREISTGYFTSNVVTLNYLQTLAWDFSDLPWTEYLMTSFHFPALTRLFCFFNRVTPESYGCGNDQALYQALEKQWTKFLTGLPMLRCFGHHIALLPLSMAETLHQALGHIDLKLDELHLWESDSSHWSRRRAPFATLADTFRILTFSEEIDAQEEPKVGSTRRKLPPVRVKAVHLYEHYLEGELISHESIDALLEMLRSRRSLTCGDERRIESFVFHVHRLSEFLNVTPNISRFCNSWSEERRARLDQLVQGGLEVRVREGTNPSNSGYDFLSNGGHFPCPCAGN